LSVVEQHVKIFACDQCKTTTEQEPRVAQVEGWVRISERDGAGVRLWDFCGWECAGTFVERGAPEESGELIEDAPTRRGRRRSEP
jgi:hypothetical protein